MFRGADGQMSFSDIEAWCGTLVPEDSFYARMYKHGHTWFRDEDFADMYKASGTGRPTLPPSLLARALILQNYASCSDRELVDRIRFDLRYKKALDLPVEHPGFHPSLLSHFRARLLLNNKESLVFERSLETALKAGVLKKDDVQAIDSMPIIGAAALQDTLTLLRTQLQKLLRAVKKTLKTWPKKTGHRFKYPFDPARYLAKEKLGKPDIPWDDEQARKEYLKELVDDARALLAAVADSELRNSEEVARAGELLVQLLHQDVDEEPPDGPEIKRGGADRVLSTNDPEMRHGRKSKSKLIKGYKGHVQTNENEIVTAVEITPANTPDSAPVPDMLAEQKDRGLEPEVVYGDCAYGDGETRETLEKMGVEVVSRELKGSRGKLFGKRDFTVDLERGFAVCPGGQVTFELSIRRDEKGRDAKAFGFSKSQCAGCPLRAACIGQKHSRRWVKLHHHEKHLQKAARQNAEPGFREDFKRRLVVERVQGRLQRYGLRLARYFSAKKVKLQALFTAAANNFWRTCQLREAPPPGALVNGGNRA